jgi:predicted CoA-binding protein
MTEDDLLLRLLRECRTIAVVGISPRPERASHDVAKYMRAQGYHIVAVNPSCTSVLGLPCYPNLTSAAAAEGVIDMVDCFRRSENIPPIADEAITIGAKCLWMQMGIVHPRSAAKARAAGLEVVMDLCLKVEHARLRGQLAMLAG